MLQKILELLGELASLKSMVAQVTQNQRSLEDKLGRATAKMVELETRLNLEKSSLKNEIMAEIGDKLVRAELEWTANRERLKRDLIREIEEGRIASEEDPSLHSLQLSDRQSSEILK